MPRFTSLLLVVHIANGFSCSVAYLFAFFVVSLDGKTLLILFFNVYLLLKDRESQSVSRGGAEGEGDTESEAGSRF